MGNQTSNGDLLLKCLINYSLLREYEIVFHTLFVRSYYFVQCVFIKVYIFYFLFKKLAFYLSVLFFYLFYFEFDVVFKECLYQLCSYCLQRCNKSPVILLASIYLQRHELLLRKTCLQRGLIKFLKAFHS